MRKEMEAPVGDTSEIEKVERRAMGEGVGLCGEGEVKGGRRGVYCFVHRYPPDVTGAGRQLQRVAEGLVERGVAMRFVAPGARDEEVSGGRGVTVRRIAKRAEGVVAEAKLAAQVVGFLRRERKQMGALQICGLSRVSYGLLAWARAAGVPAIYRGAMYGGDEPGAIAEERFGRWKVRQLGAAAAVVATTPAMEQSYRRAYPEMPVWRIPNGVDGGEFRPARDAGEKRRLREELGLRAGAKVIVTSGVACPRKRTDFLLRAVGEIGVEAGDVQFVHIGAWGDGFAERDEEYRAELERMVAGMKPGLVRAVGHTARVAEYLRAADVFAFASRKEGCPNAVLEAMASGLPVVMTRLASVGEFLVRSGVEGEIVEAEDAAGFARVMTRLLGSEEKRRWMGRNARERMETEFAMERSVGRYEEMYRSLGVQ